jgi:endonuclease/exonuclease/phosphatase family metal-dependent hydrolase
MIVTIGTFNLNNLFSRFNFQGAIQQLQSSSGPAGALTVRYEFTDANNIRVRTFLGKLVKGKDAQDTDRVAQRILAMDLDVLAVQEVENIGILREFNRENLNGRYPFQVLIEGNDPRFIDIAILSKLPLGAVTSFQTAVHPADTSRTVFGRDLLEVEVLNAQRSRRLVVLYNNHLKSHFGDDDNGGQGKVANDQRRTRQAEMIATIVAQRQRADARYVILGDMNDAPTTAPLAPMLTIDGKALTNGLANAAETQPPKADPGGFDPASPVWTHRFKPAGQPTQYELLDQIWLSEALAPRLGNAFIDRRTNLTGDGSDHDPAWVEVDL